MHLNVFARKVLHVNYCLRGKKKKKSKYGCINFNGNRNLFPANNVSDLLFRHPFILLRINNFTLIFFSSSSNTPRSNILYGVFKSINY